MNLFKRNTGITLISIIIAIIIMIIIAGVSIAMITGNNGIFNKTQTSIDKYKEAALKNQAQTVLMALKQKMKFASGNSTMAGYVKGQTDGIHVEEGTIYEEDNEYFFVDNENIGVSLINTNGKLSVGEVIGEVHRNTVNYNSNGGSETIPERKVKARGKTVNVNFDTLPTREDYRFVGWSDTQDGEAKYTEDGDTSFTMPNEDVTLYAVWKAEKRIKFDSNYTGNYTVASGTVAINDANGMYPTSYPSGNSWRYTTVNIDNDEISVGPKFEIIVNGFYNNDTASRIGSLRLDLLNSGTMSASIQLSDAWTATRVMNISYGYLNNTLVSYYGDNKYGYGYSFNGDLKITGDGTNVKAYLGNTLLNTINCTEGFSFDKIQINFACYTTYPGISMGVREIYIHEL